MGSTSRFDRKRMNVECDRLSSLPDDLIHKILSSLTTKHVVQTSVLSTRWKYIWTTTPCLDFSSNDFRTLPMFLKFVKHVLDGRNDEIEVSYVKLSFYGKASQKFVKRILNYASSHNVQQLNVTCLSGKRIDFPIKLFKSQSLKHLTLARMCITTPPAWELPALATLILDNVTFDNENTDKGAGLFYNCASLKDLRLKSCGMKGAFSDINICHSQLSNLRLETGCECVNVVAPQLKNLTVYYWRVIKLISTPNLAYLNYTSFDNYDADPLQLSTDLFHLEKVDIRVCCVYQDEANNHKIACLLRQLSSVKFLTVNLELLELLSSSVELISHQPSPFANLKSLKIYPDHVTLKEQPKPEIPMSAEVKNFLLDSSPNATFTMVSYEEIRALKNLVLARDLISEIQVLLDEWKENSETKTDHMKRGKTPTESHMAIAHEQGEVENPCRKMKSHFQERLTDIESYWEDLNKRFEKGYENTRYTLSMMRQIEMVLEKVPLSHWGKLQARFCGLCAEAQIMMDNVIDCIKIKCDKKPSLSNF